MSGEDIAYAGNSEDPQFHPEQAVGECGLICCGPSAAADCVPHALSCLVKAAAMTCGCVPCWSVSHFGAVAAAALLLGVTSVHCAELWTAGGCARPAHQHAEQAHECAG